MGTNTQIHFLSVDESHTHALSKDTKHLRLRRWPGLLLQVAFFRHCQITRVHSVVFVAPEGHYKTARSAKLILTADLTFPMSCASLGHLLMEQHCHLCLSACFSLPTAPQPPPHTLYPTPSHLPTPIDSISDITAVEKTKSKTRGAFK